MDEDKKEFERKFSWNESNLNNNIIYDEKKLNEKKKKTITNQKYEEELDSMLERGRGRGRPNRAMTILKPSYNFKASY